jgi:hypothetical protein
MGFLLQKSILFQSQSCDTLDPRIFAIVISLDIGGVSCEHYVSRDVSPPASRYMDTTGVQC